MRHHTVFIAADAKHHHGRIVNMMILSDAVALGDDMVEV